MPENMSIFSKISENLSIFEESVYVQMHRNGSTIRNSDFEDSLRNSSKLRIFHLSMPKRLKEICIDPIEYITYFTQHIMCNHKHYWSMNFLIRIAVGNFNEYCHFLILMLF